MTVYRDGSRKEQVFTRRETEIEAAEGIIERPEKYKGNTYSIKTPVGTAFITVNRGREEEIREVFVHVGKAGSEILAQSEMAGRLLSLLFRSPSKLSSEQLLEAVIDQLDGIGGSQSIGFGPKAVRSLADGIAKVLAKELKEESNPTNNSVNKKLGEFCPECGLVLFPGEGCSTCFSCGYSKCS
jgi:ribonucleoside-diphosphate reductase alpha chain